MISMEPCTRIPSAPKQIYWHFAQAPSTLVDVRAGLWAAYMWTPFCCMPAAVVNWPCA